MLVHVTISVVFKISWWSVVIISETFWGTSAVNSSKSGTVVGSGSSSPNVSWKTKIVCNAILRCRDYSDHWHIPNSMLPSWSKGRIFMKNLCLIIPKTSCQASFSIKISSFHVRAPTNIFFATTSFVTSLNTLYALWRTLWLEQYGSWQSGSYIEHLPRFFL